MVSEQYLKMQPIAMVSQRQYLKMEKGEMISEQGPELKRVAMIP